MDTVENGEDAGSRQDIEIFSVVVQVSEASVQTSFGWLVSISGRKERKRRSEVWEMRIGLLTDTGLEKRQFGHSGALL